MAKKSTVHLLWDPVNQLIHGVFPDKKSAEVAKDKLATQPGHDYDLHVVEAPAATPKG